MKEEKLSDVKNAKYYGIIFDGALDVSHIDQMLDKINMFILNMIMFKGWIPSGDSLLLLVKLKGLLQKIY